MQKQDGCGRLTLLWIEGFVDICGPGLRLHHSE